MWLLKWPLAALLLLLGLVAASDDEGSGFTYPVEEGLTFYEKDAVTVSWKSDFDSARLLLFCWEGVEEDVLTMSTLSLQQASSICVSQSIANHK